jgi:predicted ATP-dependent endonuclease of OLD family
MNIQNLHIENFKSIRNLELSNFKRINLFIGRPNVGKSNIIEALSLFSVPYLKLFSELNHLIRFENPSELFFEGNTAVQTNITINQAHKCILNYDNRVLRILLDDKTIVTENRDGGVSSIKPHKNSLLAVKRYDFNTKNLKNRLVDTPFLQPPFGRNLLDILEYFPQLRREVVDLFAQYQLRLVFDKASNTLKIMKERGGDVFLLPYTSVADTLQRVIFFKAAVASNINSCLLFEEPEAHAFPPYIAHITQEIIQSESNQFFITTHSPIVLQNFLDNARTDLAIFMVDYKDQETKVKALTAQEIFEVYKYGIDLFFNQEAYL